MPAKICCMAFSSYLKRGSMPPNSLGVEMICSDQRTKVPTQSLALRTGCKSTRWNRESAKAKGSLHLPVRLPCLSSCWNPPAIKIIKGFTLEAALFFGLQSKKQRIVVPWQPQETEHRIGLTCLFPNMKWYEMHTRILHHTAAYGKCHCSLPHTHVTPDQVARTTSNGVEPFGLQQKITPQELTAASRNAFGKG